MTYLFHDRFEDCSAGGEACNWTVLRNSDLPHGHHLCEEGKYIITAPGNRHLANTPALRTFTLEATWTYNQSTFGDWIHLFFAYDVLKRRGYFVSLRFGKKQCVAALGREDNNAFTTIAQKTFAAQADNRSLQHLKFTVSKEQVEVQLGNFPAQTLALPPESDYQGRIGFDGTFELREVKISSGDVVVEEELIPETAITFPAEINGFHTPLCYKIRMVKFAGTARLDLELSGSDVENPDVPWYPYHGLMVDMLTAPYLRLEEERLYPAGKQKLVLAKPNPVSQKFFYDDIHKKPEWSIRHSFFLAKIPKIDQIGIGYEHCVIRECANHLAGGPSEAVFDLAQEKIIYAGKAVRPGQPVLELHSQPDKEICRRIPATDPRYNAAQAFARRNHFFIAPESGLFQAVLRYVDADFSPADFQLNCRLEDAFKEEITKIPPLSWSAEKKTAAGFTEVAAVLPPQTLPAGVYHLHFELYFAGRIMIDQHHAFEIMSDAAGAPAAPLLSGLPFLFSMPNEDKGLEHDQFDPWGDVENSPAHYLSAATHYPAIGRKYRTYDVLKSYHRQWFLWLTTRTAEDSTLAHNHDIIKQCDFIHPPYDDRAYGCGPYHELWKPSYALRGIMPVLLAFLRSDGFHSDHEQYLTVAAVEKLVDSGEEIPETMLAELANKHWAAWLEYFDQWLVGDKAAQQRELQAINPNVKHSTYGPMNCYLAHYKTSYVLKYRGVIPRFYDGFFVFEDYPFSCKYNLHRGPFLLTSIQMAAPECKMYPEVYPSFIQGCPDGAVGYAWPPFGCPEHPPQADKKRYLEYAYASVWFIDGKFNYWRDYGFHVRALPQERFDVLLDSWKFIHKTPAAKPLRGAAYVCSDMLCAHHSSFYEHSHPGTVPWGDVINTAEEVIPYVWETVRIDGQQSGFLCALEALSELNARDIGLLVLPPLNGATPEQLAAIRKLHECGINLLAFETVDGLEDLFGVTLLPEPVAVNHIAVNSTLSDNPLAELDGITEYTEHPLCKAGYCAAGAEVLLQGEASVLFLNRTKHGLTALFNLPPTAVRRDTFYKRTEYGRLAISELINRSVALIHRKLCAATVTTTAGKLLTFEAKNGNLHIIVTEDAFPADASPITPLVTINLPDLKQEQISCDKDFHLVSLTETAAAIRLQLGTDDTVILTVSHL